MTNTRQPLSLTKRLTAAPLAVALLLGAGSTVMPGITPAAHAAAATTTSINLHYASQTTAIPAIASAQGETLVNLIALGKALNFSVQWDAKSGYISIKQANKTLRFKPEDSYYELNGHSFYVDSTPTAISGRTYVPLRATLTQLGYSVGYQAKDKLVTVTLNAENSLTLSGKLIDVSNDKATNKVQYPQLSGFANTAVQEKLNAFFLAKAEEYIQSGKELPEQMEKDWGDTDRPIVYETNVNYVITKNQDNQLSMYFIPYEYTGGAHGMYDYHAYTFDLTTGEQLTLQQVASDNPKFKSIINTAIQKQIKDRKMELLTPFTSIRDDQGFFLRGNSVVVYFSLYEYVPYAFGMPEFSIPLSAFK
jgi:hypothetical protein